MYVTKHLKCPDEGIAYQLISVTEDGQTHVEAYLSKQDAYKFMQQQRIKAVREQEWNNKLVWPGPPDYNAPQIPHTHEKTAKDLK